MKRLLIAAAAAACFVVFAGAAPAATTSISGTAPRGGCGPTHPIAVSGASRIEVSVSTTAASNLYYTQILDPSGNAVAGSGSYDTPSGGTYGVRVCTYGDAMDPPQISYEGVVGTGPAGQPALPRQAGGVAGAFTTLNSRSVSGHGAILTRAGLAWVTVRADTNGNVHVRLDNAARKLHVNVSGGMRAVFGSSSVRITGNGLTLVVVDRGASDRMSIRSNRLKASGKVVRGGFQISV
jgi:hypothetical protein